MKPTLTIEELTGHLKTAHVALYRSDCFAAVGRSVADAMHEASSALEILTNLHYLLRICGNDKARTVEYLEEAEVQARRLAAITSRLAHAHRTATKDAELQAPEFVM